MTDQATMPPIEILSPAETTPANPRWHELRRSGVSASEIAAVMGLSPWQSAFSLYWSKANGWDGESNEYTTTGTHLEDAIARWWWNDVPAVPKHWLRPAGLYAHPDRPWQLATPDRLVMQQRAGREHLAALLECKWVGQPTWEGWGEPGTDEIPVYYRAQGLWQLDVLGVDEVHFAVLGPGGFRAYLLRRNEAAEEDLRVMRSHAVEFMGQLTAGIAPDLDGHSATLTALRKLHPSVGEGDVQVSVELAERYRIARAEKKDAEARVDQCEAEIRVALGSEFNRAVVGKKLVASRSVYDQSGDSAELTALEDDWPVVDRLNPGRSASYA